MADDQVGATSDPWEHRVGQIETVLSYFGATFVVEVERADGVAVYVQGRRDGDQIEIEAVGNEFLPTHAHLDAERITRMSDLGWDRPNAEAPNFGLTIFKPDEQVLSAAASLIARTLAEVYQARPDDEWSVIPTEFGTATIDINEDGIFDIFGEGEVVNWGWKSASQYAAVPRHVHEVIIETMRVGGQAVRSGPNFDGTLGALGLRNVVGAKLVASGDVVFLRTHGDEVRFRLTEQDAADAVQRHRAGAGLTVTATDSGPDPAEDGYVEVVLGSVGGSPAAAPGWEVEALRLALKAMRAAVA